MKFSKSRSGPSAALATALFLGACSRPTVQSLGRGLSGSSASLSIGGRTLASRLSVGVAPVTIPNLDRGPSWIGSDARKRSPHLWISDSVNGDVDIFTMPKLKLTGTLKGFKEPQGLCTDKQSNVWIVATADRKIYEYSRSGKNLLKTIKDNSGYPASCAINQRNGDLAITNIISSDNPYEPGNLMIYKGAHRYTHNVHAREPVRILFCRL